MDGIFVAYHNTARIFGFQYLPLSVLSALLSSSPLRAISRTELDERLFGSTEMADQAFKLCVSSLEILLEEVVKPFPDQVGLSGIRLGLLPVCFGPLGNADVHVRRLR